MIRLDAVRDVERLKVDGFSIEAAFLCFVDRHGRQCEVYAERCLVDRPDAPALVHCPGGGQTVNRADLIDWARKGFSCVSFDWQIGDFPAHDPARKSRWPTGVVGQSQVIDSGRHAILPLAIHAAGICIDWLVTSDSVNEDKIGVTGISWGGYLTWLIAAYEPRIKAAVPVYGMGGHFDNRHPGQRHLPPAIEEYWRMNWDPFFIAARQTKPICYLSCTNDFFGILPLADELLNQLAVPRRRSWLANCNHSISPSESALGLAWFKHFLDAGPPVPSEPSLKDDFTIEADQPDEIALSEIWWTPDLRRGDCGCWINGKPNRHAAAAYGRVHYKSGFSLCTPLKLNPPFIASAQTSHHSLLNGIGWNWDMGSTQFHTNDVATEDCGDGTIRVTRAPGRKDNSPSFFLNQFADPAWNTGEAQSFTLGLRADPVEDLKQATLTLSFHSNEDPKELNVIVPITQNQLVLNLQTLPSTASHLKWRNLVRVHIHVKSTARTFIVGPLLATGTPASHKSPPQY